MRKFTPIAIPSLRRPTACPRDPVSLSSGSRGQAVGRQGGEIAIEPNPFPVFYWSGINLQGKKLSGELSAANKKTAKAQLKQQQIFILKLSRKYHISFTFPKKISSKQIIFLFRQLATLVVSGIPLVQSLIILHKSQTNPAFQELIRKIKIELESGKELSVTLNKFPRYFDRLTCQLIQVGERTGSLANMLLHIAAYKEKSRYLKMQIIQSLFYPCIILMVAMIVMIIMLSWVVPRFAALFDLMHHQLPVLTLFVIQLSYLFQHYGWFGILLSLLIGFSIRYFVKSISLRAFRDKLLIHISVIKYIILIRFTRSLAIAFNAGIAINEALPLVAETSGNTFYTHAILNLQTGIMKGQQLHRSMQVNPAFPSLMIQMIKIGEESGMLGKMLEKIAEIYENETEHLLNIMTQMLEPLIMVILGVLIGGLVIAMYLPIFKLGTLL